MISKITDSQEEHIVRCLGCEYREKVRNRKKARKAKKWHLKTNNCKKSLVDYGPVSMVNGE